MTGPTPAMRNAAHVEAMRLDSVPEMDEAARWLDRSDVVSSIDGDSLWISNADGTRVRVRLGQWLTYEPDSGEFAVYDDEHYRQQHTGIGEAGCG